MIVDNDYLEKLPKNALLAANKLCTDFSAGALKDDPEDIAHVLEVLLDGRLQEGWDKAVDAADGEASGFFGKSAGKTRVQKRIDCMHRHVKALAAKATIIDPALINSFLIEFTDGERLGIEAQMARARGLLREAKARDAEHQKGFLKLVDLLQAEADRRHSDFRVFLDGMVQAMDRALEAGPDMRPVFDALREGFEVADKARKSRESREAAQPPRALPAPQARTTAERSTAVATGARP